MRKVVLSLVAVLATLSLVSTAAASGGSGGGGGGKGGGGGGRDPKVACATINFLTLTANSSTSFTSSWSLTANCPDEGLTNASMDFTASTNNITGRGFFALNPGLNGVTAVFNNGTPGATYTETLTVYGPNSQVIDTRTAKVTLPSS
jgi:hypothetical protein